MSEIMLPGIQGGEWNHLAVERFIIETKHLKFMFWCPSADIKLLPTHQVSIFFYVGLRLSLLVERGRQSCRGATLNLSGDNTDGSQYLHFALNDYIFDPYIFYLVANLGIPKI